MLVKNILFAFFVNTDSLILFSIANFSYKQIFIIRFITSVVMKWLSPINRLSFHLSSYFANVAAISSGVTKSGIVEILVVYLNLSQYYSYVSWFVQLHSWFDLTTGLALKNYPILTFDMLKSLLCISIDVNFTFMSADLYSWTAELT